MNCENTQKLYEDLLDSRIIENMEELLIIADAFRDEICDIIKKYATDERAVQR